MFSTSTKTPISSEEIAEALTKQQAKELTSKLTSEERALFLAALKEFKSEEDKAGFEGNVCKKLLYILHHRVDITWLLTSRKRYW